MERNLWHCLRGRYNYLTALVRHIWTKNCIEEQRLTVVYQLQTIVIKSSLYTWSLLPSHRCHLQDSKKKKS
ncbi:hypothetical protein KP509_15G010700 [Ceratopteris richardii]|uniref:Uncharacterized protein n=1 Tax=Ceratopteris richardii TaxID=49495 RepID=A0A8T2T6U3_CERRI|nr:hypothetical protein KP509_15G010700 [Ceratopteris richardii]